MRLRRLTVLLATMAAATTLTACGGSESAEVAAPTTEVAAPDPETAELTIETVEQMNATLQEMTGATLGEIEVSLMSVTPAGSMSVDALDPAKPTEFNRYVAYPDGRTDVRPYDYGGSDQLPALRETLFPADSVAPQTLVDVWNDSFERVEGERADLSASGPTVTRADDTGPIEIYVVNGPERDRQTVYYDAAGAFLRVS